MGDERTLYESETKRTIPEVIDFLQQLTQWLGDRRLVFHRDGEEVVIEIPDDVVLEIEIEEEAKGKKRVKRSLEIEIEWTENRGAVAEAEMAVSREMAVDEEE